MPICGVGRIRPPSGAFRNHEIIQPVLLENGRRLHAVAYERPDILAAEIEIIVGQLRNMDDAVGLRRADMVRLAVIIDE